MALCQASTIERMKKSKIPIINIRPEYTGRNPLTYIAAPRRENGTTHHSEAAIKALESYEAKTGIKTPIRRCPK